MPQPHPPALGETIEHVPVALPRNISLEDAELFYRELVADAIIADDWTADAARTRDRRAV